MATATRVSALFDGAAAANELRVTSRGSDRRAHARLTPGELQCPIRVRFKYGETVTLLDVSTGGALLETSRRLQPDTDLVLEILDSRTRDVAPVVSRVLRSHVSGLEDGILYRGACAFKKPLVHPALVAPPPLLKTDANDFLKLEFALKTIVEGYFRQPTSAASAAGRWRNESALLDALVCLRDAAERRQNPIDRQLAQLLAIVIPALQRRDGVEAVTTQLQDQLARHLPLLAIRSNRQQQASAPDRELMTMNVWAERDEVQVAVTAEFPAGFGLDEVQFRLLKAGAYLMGLAGNWRAATPAVAAIAEPRAAATARPEPATCETQSVPIGWDQIVVRYADGRLLRGYTIDFDPGRAHLHVCPTINCAAAERLLVPFARLKAVFFVKDLNGDPTLADDQTFDHNPRARKVEITFRDGEVLTGSTLNYKPHVQGFFVQPANSRSNNVRIFVVAPAIRHMRFLR